MGGAAPGVAGVLTANPPPIPTTYLAPSAPTRIPVAIPPGGRVSIWHSDLPVSRIHRHDPTVSSIFRHAFRRELSPGLSRPLYFGAASIPAISWRPRYPGHRLRGASAAGLPDSRTPGLPAPVSPGDAATCDDGAASVPRNAFQFSRVSVSTGSAAPQAYRQVNVSPQRNYDFQNRCAAFPFEFLWVASVSEGDLSSVQDLLTNARSCYRAKRWG